MPDASDQTDAIPTITIRPEKTAGGKGDPIPQGGKLSRDQITDLITREMPGLSRAGIEGITRNIERESGGDPTNDTGDHGTSGGLFQHHNTRLADLKSYAEKEGTSWQDPTTQVKFAATELKKNYPTLLSQLQKADDPAEAEDSFKRVFERPASIMWENNPRLATDKYKFSDYALGEHKGRKNTDMVYMSPGDYLDLSPDLDGKPFESPSGRSIKQSVDRGDEIESVPSLDLKVNGNTAQVTDQDGRHRALLAQEHGVDAIPVAVRQTGQGTPTEIQGLSGNVLPNDFQRNPPKSLLSRIGSAIGGAIIPPAGAAERETWGEGDEVLHPAPAQSGGADWGAGDEVVKAAPAAAPAQSQQDSVLDRVGTGIKDVAVGFNQALAHLPDPMSWFPGSGGINQMRQEHRDEYDQYVKDREASIQAAKGSNSGIDWPRVAGNVIGTVPLSALNPAAAGAASGFLQPSTGDDYWADKAKQTAGGAAGGKVAGTVGNALNRIVAPKLQPMVKMLMDEGVELTPGQMAGGAAKAAEDKLTSAPLTGDAIAAARRRSFETFNRAAWNRVLEPLGEKMPDTVKMGRQAMDYAHDRTTDAYKRILPNLSLSSIQNDPVFTADMTAAINDARSALKDADFRHFENIVRSQFLEKIGPTGSTADGELINGIDSMLGSEARGYKGGPTHDERKLGEAIEGVQSAYRTLLERQNPNHAQALRAARFAWANYVRVGKAASAQGTATTDGIFSPAQLNAAVRSEDGTTRKLGYGRGRALLQDLSDAGQAVLPSKYPDSGTTGRALLAGLTAGAGGAGAWLGHPEMLLGLLAGAAPYTPPASKAVNAIVNKLSQQPGPTRNALAAGVRGLGQGLAPAFGVAGSQITPSR